MTSTIEAESEASPSEFPHVVELGGEAAETAAKKLSELCDTLENPHVGTAAERIWTIDKLVGTLSFPVIERLVAPERVLAELDDVLNQPARRLHAWRNQVALLPLLLTWLSIGLAVLIGNSAALTPIYGTVGVVDAVLIGCVVWLTRQVHVREQAAIRDYDKIAEQMDTAIRSLAIAMEGHALAHPANAEEWAVAARDVLEEARKQTGQLFESTMTVIDKANQNLASVHTETGKLIELLAEQSRKTLDSLQQTNEQMVTEVVKQAVQVLNSAVTEDRELVSNQLAPLIEQFQANVESFAHGSETYQENIGAFVAVTSDVGVAAKILGESAKSYTDIATSIDSHLGQIDESQQHFIRQVTDSARDMGTAASSMETVSTLLSDRLHADLAQITQHLNESSSRLAAVDNHLDTTTNALAHAATELRTAAQALPRRGWWPRREQR